MYIGDSSASTRHYVAAGTNLYKGKTKTRKVNRAVGREKNTSRWHNFKRERDLIF